ncbi:glycosyltransferase family 2 protein [Teredinibacter turnerae]|uniref:hypothetical protein n=1 Tax=Teredinibacter turnerae TaxID=2426 RepID=UPI0003A89F54|nr:hypothetical protein [Teredinibacter turnerae]
MKLKELPKSLALSWKLSRMSGEQMIGVSRAKADNCIVSFTSIPSRLSILHLTVRSLLCQTLCPEKIVLWLHQSLENQIPAAVSRLLSDKFEIRFSEETCAHRKLVESHRLFANKVIVTCDDDVMYPPNWLEKLWTEHQMYPDDVIGNECRHVRYDAEGCALPYWEWKGVSAGESSPYTLAIGYSGVLYPPGCLHPDVAQRELYDALAPRADDLWFKAMSLRVKTRTRRANVPAEKPTPIAFSQRYSLKHSNVRSDGNLVQWQALDARYSLKQLMELQAR